MSLDLHGDEIRVVNYLRAALGLSDTAARIYTAVLCRQYRAPRGELISAVQYHLPAAGIVAEARASVSIAIDGLIEKNLLRVVPGLLKETVEANSRWADALRAHLPVSASVDDNVVRIVSESLKSFADFSPRERALIERLGWATWDSPRRSLQEAVRQAKRILRLGVYSSITVYEEIRDDIRAALINRDNMTVQILMFDPDLAARIEDNPDLARDVRGRTRDWQALFEEARKEALTLGHTPRLEIRYIADEKLTGFHRVALVDDRIWLLNIHRPGVERGIEGIVYQGQCEDGHASNIHRMLEHYWNTAWQQARDVRRSRRLMRGFLEHRHLLVVVLMPVLAWYLHATRSDWFGIKNDWWGGAAIGLMIAELYNSLGSIAELVSRSLDCASRVIRQLVRSTRR